MEELVENKEFIELREFFDERIRDIAERWRIISQYELRDEYGNINEDELAKIFADENIHVPIMKYLTYEAFINDLKMKIESFRNHDIKKNEDFEFYRELKESDYNPLRMCPEPGITQVRLRYHESQPVYASDDLPETGFRADKVLRRMIRAQYPIYMEYLSQYCRPLGTTDATFKDFNREQKSSTPNSPERNEIILKLIKKFLGVKPYKPVHYEGTAFARLPLSTGTGYFNRHHYKTKALAQLTHGAAYQGKPTSKGYFFNANYRQARMEIHNMKHFAHPHCTHDEPQEEKNFHMAKYFAKKATMLFTRNHISKAPKLKQRPVYNVDDTFLKMETMLTLPALVQARPVSSCLMYSLETIRGGCHYLDQVAKGYLTYFTIDWSSFDQRIPRVITDLYYTDFLESLIIVNKGYQLTITYPNNLTYDTEPMFKKMSNLLHVLHEWYNSMVFVTADGYAYQRTCAGVPSGLFNTQYLDSFANLYIIIDALIEFKMTPEEIENIRFFIMGDDNTGFTHLPIHKLEAFIEWFEIFALEKWNMCLSKTKSIITSLRNKIEILSYQCNFGYPLKDIGKLVAQLCYPEHKIKPKYMSYRALGIAYAAAGSDPTFHQFCRDVYMLYLPHCPELTLELKRKIQKHLPGPFKALDNYFSLIDFSKFPSIHEVQHVYSTWQGSLGYEPKWDKSYFLEDPFTDNEEDIMTILDYRRTFNIPRRDLQYYDINTILKV